MKSRRVPILSALALLIGGAFAASPLLAAGPEETGRRADDARAVERPTRRTIILDGVPFAPGELKRYPGQPLTFVHTREGEENGVVYAFTSPEVADEFMRREFRKEFGVEPGVDASHVLCPPNAWQQHYSLFNKDVGCGGSANLTMYEGQEYANLDFNGWNNRISCVKAACVGAWTTLYSCRFFEMDWQTDCNDPDRELISPGVVVTDLNTKGFNNRTSSIRFCYTYDCGDL